MPGFHAKTLKEQDPERYANVGKPWLEEDIVKLLACVQKKMNYSDIAEKHKRTDTSILFQLKSIAADYYFNDNMPLANIMKYTGLSAEQISDAIAKRQYRTDMAEKKKIKVDLPSVTAVKKDIPDSSEDVPRKGTRDEFYTVISELLEVAKDIQRMMKDFHSDTFVSKS
jgi:CRISPR/Cas system CSM-associated protein Csm2 small subunit